jgi:peptide chain release factor
MIVWLQVTSGRGPAECCFVVAKVASIIQKAAEKLNFQIRILDSSPGPKPRTFSSVLLAVDGEDSVGFAKSWNGTIKWIGSSPYRPKHKRKNWFVGVTLLSPSIPIQWSENDFKVEAMKSSGPGGQHANKTESAVRVTHIPTGLSSIAQEERSQQLNKKLAIARVLSSLESVKENAEKEEQKKRWSLHNQLERGNAVKIFKGHDFKETAI